MRSTDIAGNAVEITVTATHNANILQLPFPTSDVKDRTMYVYLPKTEVVISDLGSVVVNGQITNPTPDNLFLQISEDTTYYIIGFDTAWGPAYCIDAGPTAGPCALNTTIEVKISGLKNPDAAPATQTPFKTTINNHYASYELLKNSINAYPSISNATSVTVDNTAICGERTYASGS